MNTYTVTGIAAKMVIISRKNNSPLVLDDAKYGLTITPVSVENLQGEIYQLKPNASIQRAHVNLNDQKKELFDREDIFVIKAVANVVEYINKSDTEPYVLSDYDKSRLEEYDKKTKARAAFDTLILPSIKAIIKEYNLAWSTPTKNIMEIEYHLSDHFRSETGLNYSERVEEIISKFKDLGCKVIVSRDLNSICKIDLNQSMINMGLAGK